MFFGYMVNAYVSDAMLPFGQKTVIVGISGFVAHDILRGVKKISRAIGNDPDVFLKIIMNRKIEFPDKDKPEKPK